SCFNALQEVKENKPKMIQLENGLQYQTILAGKGPQAKVGDEVFIHEIMRYSDSTVLFSTDQIGQPVKFKIGANQAIEGLDIGVRGMQAGEKRTLIVPPSLSKRTEYPAHVSADSTLYYEVELVEIIPSKTVTSAVLYRSQDQGKTWQEFSKGLPPTATISGLTVLNDQIWASTDFHGLFVSQRGEDNWQALHQGLPNRVDINTIIVSGANLVIGTLEQGVFFSSDNGQNWTKSKTDLSEIPIRAFIQTENQLIAGTDAGFYASGDHGLSWTHQFGNQQILGFTKLNNKLYAAAFNGALMSKDGGKTWDYIFQKDALHDVSHDGTYVYAMTLGQALQRTRDDGITWEIANDGMGTYNLYTFELEYIQDRQYVAQWIGIYKSENHGNSWQLVDGPWPDSTAFATMELTSYGLLAGVAMRK
ncbi:MAG: FKBP-type peptidyl-prolyl cis-trans isomerase, partial [Bacteroidota bacterium]